MTQPTPGDQPPIELGDETKPGVRDSAGSNRSQHGQASATAPSKVSGEKGYPKLAKFMVECDDVVIFRQFRNLNMINLMRLQAKLMDLELSYSKECSDDDSSNDITRKGFTQSFYNLREYGPESRQSELLDQIQCTLYKYNAALLQVSQVSKLEAPDKYDIKRLREWLEDKDKGAEFLSAPEEGTWSEENDSDQVTLMSRENGFSRWTATLFIHIYDVIWGRHRKATRRVDIERNQTYYPDSNIKSVAKVFTSVLASLLPGIVILVLYLIKTTVKRIGAMLCFTAFFAFILSFWTLADTVDIFAATAAFAAVEVVFIGSAITNGTSS